MNLRKAWILIVLLVVGRIDGVNIEHGRRSRHGNRERNSAWDSRTRRRPEKGEHSRQHARLQTTAPRFSRRPGGRRNSRGILGSSCFPFRAGTGPCGPHASKPAASVLVHLTGKPAHPIEVTITEKDAVKPVLEARLKPLEKAGFQRIRSGGPRCSASAECPLQMVRGRGDRPGSPLQGHPVRRHDRGRVSLS